MSLSIGKVLQEAREDMGASLEDVVNETKIRRKYIDALENNQFEVLPGKVYVRGFLRSYARFLGLDGKDLVSQYDELLRNQIEKEETIKEPVAPQVKRPSGWRKGLTLTVAMLIVGAMIYWGGEVSSLSQQDDPNSQGIHETENNENENNQINNPASKNGNSTPKNENDVAPNAQGVDVELQVTDKECWMLVKVDNENVFEGRVEPQELKTFKGKENIWVKLGNVQAVRVKANGKDYGFLGGPNDDPVKKFSVVAEADKLYFP